MQLVFKHDEGVRWISGRTVFEEEGIASAIVIRQENIRHYEFPTAAVTSHHKTCDLKQHKCVLLQFWKQKSKISHRVKVSARPISSGVCRGGSMSLPFLSSRGCLHFFPYNLFHHSSLLFPCSHFLLPFHSQLYLRAPLIMMLMMTGGVFQDNPESSPYLKMKIWPMTSANPFCYVR